MVDEKVIEYIRGRLTAGMTVADVKKLLLQNGWTEAEASEVLSQFGTSQTAGSEKPRVKSFFHLTSRSLIKILITTIVTTGLFVAAGFWISNAYPYFLTSQFDRIVPVREPHDAVPLAPGQVSPPEAPVVKADEAGATAHGVRDTIDGSNQFGFDLYAILSKTSGNAFFSPYSISTALAIAYEGATSSTAAEMQKVLHLPEDAVVRRSSFATIANELNAATSSYQLNVANALWAQKDFSFLSEYTQTIKRYYLGDTSNLDFKTAADVAVQTINAWVAEKTSGKIPTLLASLDPLTRLVITNAVYFKGTWETKFDTQQTDNEDFHLTKVKMTEVPMMNLTHHFAYAQNDSAQMLELPYKGRSLSMIIVLPKVNDIATYEKKLSYASLQALQKSLAPTLVEVHLPLFTFAASYDLGAPLQQLGMKIAFTDKANFSGMDGANDLSISKVVHKAYVAVNEEGTEAAAATAVAITTQAIAVPVQPTVFLADHPFDFFIVDTTNDSILFFGRVVDPTTK